MLKFPIKRTIIIDDTKKKGRKKKDGEKNRYSRYGQRASQTEIGKACCTPEECKKSGYCRITG